MANITRQRTGEFLRKVFDLLWDKPEGLQAKEVLEHIGTTTELTGYESGTYASSPNTKRFEKIIRFATVDLVKAGWLIKTKGRWTLTDLGKDAYNKYPDPEEFYKEAVRLYQKWKKSRPTSKTIATLVETPDTYLTMDEAQEQAWEQVKGFLQSINPYDFQKVVGDLLLAMGYHVAWISPPGKDRGIDIIAYRDPLGTTAPRIKVQVKHRREQSVTVEGLRAFMATLGTDDVGIFVSSGGFTSDAKDESRTQERRKITLIDLEQFYDLWIEFYDRLTQDARQRFPLKPVYYLDQEE